MNSQISINDLKYDELRIILGTLSVRQLFNCLRVCKKWKAVIEDILQSQTNLTLLYNDVNNYTKQELDRMCSNLRHIPINSSIGRIIGSRAIISAFYRFEFPQIRDRFFNIIRFCPNIESLNLTEYSVKNSDIQLILSHCPKLECLSISSNEKFWGNSLLTSISGLKHLSLSLTSRTPVFASGSSSINLGSPKVEELVIDGASTDSNSEDILYHLLKAISSKIIKFHFRPSSGMSYESVLKMIEALSGDQFKKTNIKILNIDVPAFNQMLEAINDQLLSLEVLYLHFNSQSDQNVSLKRLKNLKQIHLSFDTTNFGLGNESDSENSVQFFTFLSNIPSTIRKLTLSSAFISLSVFKQIIVYSPFLEELELNYVCIEMDSKGNFWQEIATFKSLQRLTLNLTDISDDGCEHLANSESLHTLELVKYNGPRAGQTLISSDKMIESFGNLAALNQHKWFNLRLDIDVFEVNEEIKRKIPRNMRLLNVGFEK